MVDTNGKFPKLVIKKFGGNNEEYQAFWDSFNAAIHSNETLNDIEKLNYLCSFLEGPAVATIAGLALRKDNYKVAMKLRLIFCVRDTTTTTTTFYLPSKITSTNTIINNISKHLEGTGT